MFRKTLTAAALALTVAAPMAHADGQIVIDYQAQNQEEANAIQFGLVAYQLLNGADPAQVLNGCSNGVIVQEGNDHTGSLVQNGDCQNYGLIQVGNGTEQHVVQNQNGESGIGLVIGFD